VAPTRRQNMLPSDPQMPELDIDELRVDELAKLSSVIHTQFTREDLLKWYADSPAHSTFLARAIFGRVRWPKGLGQPIAATLADGLRITHYFNSRFVYVDEHMVQRTVDTWFPGPPVSTWDIADPDDYLVGFMTFSLADLNRVEVDRANGVAWERGPVDRGVTMRRVNPHEREFQATVTPMVLEEFEITTSLVGSSITDTIRG
jgi:hypothetical protein